MHHQSADGVRTGRRHPIERGDRQAADGPLDLGMQELETLQDILEKSIHAGSFRTSGVRVLRELLGI